MPTAMPYRNLGACGLKVSAFALGGWTTYGDSVTDQGTVNAVIKAAHEAGVNFFDSADIYNRGETEKSMGAALKDFKRQNLVLSSKVFWPMSDDVNDRGLSRKHIMESIDKSLSNMGTEYLDLYFCHRYDEATPLEETVRAMDDLVRAGKVLYWGTSEWTGAQIQNACSIADRRNCYRPQVEQPQYSLLARKKVETDVVPAVRANGLGLVTWSPLASGLLTGKYDAGVPENSRFARMAWLRDSWLREEHLSRVRFLKGIADSLGTTRSKLALAWLLNQPGVSSVILGATSVEQLKENLGALDVKLWQEVAQQMEQLFPVM